MSLDRAAVVSECKTSTLITEPHAPLAVRKSPVTVLPRHNLRQAPLEQLSLAVNLHAYLPIQQAAISPRDPMDRIMDRIVDRITDRIMDRIVDRMVDRMVDGNVHDCSTVLPSSRPSTASHADEPTSQRVA